MRGLSLSWTGASGRHAPALTCTRGRLLGEPQLAGTSHNGLAGSADGCQQPLGGRTAQTVLLRQLGQRAPLDVDAYGSARSVAYADNLPSSSVAAVHHWRKTAGGPGELRSREPHTQSPRLPDRRPRRGRCTGHR